MEHFRPSEMKRDYNPYKNRKIRKIKKAGLQPVVMFVRNELQEPEAFEFETSLIECIGRKKNGGPLTNIYDGGYGATKSPETRRKLSESMRRWHAEHESPCLGKPCSEQTKHKISTALKGREMSAEWIEKIRHTKMTTKRPPNTGNWLFTSPDGQKFEVNGLKTFCGQHGLKAAGHIIKDGRSSGCNRFDVITVIPNTRCHLYRSQFVLCRLFSLACPTALPLRLCFLGMLQDQT